MPPYKTCTCCKYEFPDKLTFINYCDFVGEWKEFGLLLYNCQCRSTLSIEITEGSKEEAMKLRNKERQEKNL